MAHTYMYMAVNCPFVSFFFHLYLMFVVVAVVFWFLCAVRVLTTLHALSLVAFFEFHSLSIPFFRHILHTHKHRVISLDSQQRRNKIKKKSNFGIPVRETESTIITAKNKQTKRNKSAILSIFSDFHAHFILFVKFFFSYTYIVFVVVAAAEVDVLDVQPVACFCGHICLWKFLLNLVLCMWWICRSNKKHKLQLTGDHISLYVTILRICVVLVFCCCFFLSPLVSMILFYAVLLLLLLLFIQTILSEMNSQEKNCPLILILAQALVDGLKHF